MSPDDKRLAEALLNAQSIVVEVVDDESFRVREFEAGLGGYGEKDEAGVYVPAYSEQYALCPVN
jgi:hypothetical protein